MLHSVLLCLSRILRPQRIIIRRGRRLAHDDDGKLWMGIGREEDVHAHVTHTLAPAAAGLTKNSGNSYLTMWTLERGLSSHSPRPFLSCRLPRFIRLSVRSSSQSSRKYCPPASGAAPRFLTATRTRTYTTLERAWSLSSAGYTATMFLEFSWTIARSATRFLFILSNTLRETTTMTTTQRATRTLLSSLFTNFGRECRELLGLHR